MPPIPQNPQNSEYVFALFNGTNIIKIQETHDSSRDLNTTFSI
jgi:hypothetical protein